MASPAPPRDTPAGPPDAAAAAPTDASHLLLRRLAIVAVVALTAWIAVHGEASWLGWQRPRPNVLLVSIDSLRADHLGAYGHANDTSPTIDALARDGALFEWAITSAPWTIPAHATMLSGLPPEVHGVTSYVRRLAPEAVTLAEVLRDAGYATAAFVSGPTVMARYGFDQGFASYDESMVEPDPHKSARGATAPGLVALLDGFLDRWSGAGRQQPFFVFLHIWDVHYDYAPPPPYDRMFDPDYQGSITGDDYSRNDKVSRKMAPRDLEHVRALYDGEIRFTDDHLGKIVATLRRLGIFDDTIIVVTSDHGDEFFEHGLKGHGVALYDEVVHVPLVIRYPERIAARQRIVEQVRLMDIAPTILGLAQIAPPPDFAAPGLRDRAIDLSPWLTAGSNAERPGLPAFSQTLIGLRHESVRTQHAKLIQRINETTGKTFVMLYDLAADPGESYNLNREKPPPSSRQVLDGMLSAWRAETGREKSLAIPLRHEPEQEDRLRALGYVE